MSPGAFAWFSWSRPSRSGMAARRRGVRGLEPDVAHIMTLRENRVHVLRACAFGTMLRYSMFQMRNVFYGDVLMITRSVTEYALSRSPRSVTYTPPPG